MTPDRWFYAELAFIVLWTLAKRMRLLDRGDEWDAP